MIDAMCASLLGFRDRDRVQQFVHIVLDQVWQLTYIVVVPLDHVQVQLELFGDGGVGRFTVVCVLTSLAVLTAKRRER